MREFNYVNDLGLHKRIVVGIKKMVNIPLLFGIWNTGNIAEAVT